MIRSPKQPSFAALVQEFFGDRLIQQQNASAHTVASYRDTFRLLLQYFQKRRKSLTTLAMEDFDAPVLLAFLNDLEKHRKNSVRTRNVRLAALRSFMKYRTSARSQHSGHCTACLGYPDEALPPTAAWLSHAGGSNGSDRGPEPRNLERKA